MDVVILDGWLPDEWPPGVPVVVINPPGALGPVAARKLDAPIPYNSVRVETQDHPVLFRVSSGRVALTQTAVLEVKSPLQALWNAGNSPILAAGEVSGQRVVIMGFSPGLSERLPLTASFPLLMGNALFWCADHGDSRDASRLLPTGSLTHVTGGSVTWTTTREGRESKRVSLPITSDIIEIDRTGMWESDSGLKGAAALLSSEESDVPVNHEGMGGDAGYFAVKSSITENLRFWLLSGLILFLLLESWLFHRLAVY